MTFIENHLMPDIYALHLIAFYQIPYSLDIDIPLILLTKRLKSCDIFVCEVTKSEIIEIFFLYTHTHAHHV